MMRTCAYHGKNHHEDSVTAFSPSAMDVMNGDPQPEPAGTTVWLCDVAIRAMERTRRALERGRRAYPRRRAA